MTKINRSSLGFCFLCHDYKALNFIIINVASFRNANTLDESKSFANRVVEFAQALVFLWYLLQEVFAKS